MPKVDVDAMLEGMREQLEKDQTDGRLAGITVGDLADAVSHPKAAEVIGTLMEAEGTSVPQGAPAPDFSLPWLSGAREDGRERMTLSDHFGKRPVALIFGSYT